nr:MAG TPA: hypothetical protein [Caudoviricetes sp.]
MVQSATNILYQAKCPSLKTKAPLRPFIVPDQAQNCNRRRIPP